MSLERTSSVVTSIPKLAISTSNCNLKGIWRLWQLLMGEGVDKEDYPTHHGLNAKTIKIKIKMEINDMDKISYLAL